MVKYPVVWLRARSYGDVHAKYGQTSVCDEANGNHIHGNDRRQGIPKSVAAAFRPVQKPRVESSIKQSHVCTDSATVLTISRLQPYHSYTRGI